MKGVRLAVQYEQGNERVCAEPWSLKDEDMAPEGAMAVALRMEIHI